MSNKNYMFYSAYYVPGIILSILASSVKYILLYSHFIDGETEVKKLSTPNLVGKPGFGAWQSASHVCAITPTLNILLVRGAN